MQKYWAKLVFGAAITAVIAVAAGEVDKSSGTWKLNMEKSKFSPSAPIKSLTQTREASDGGIKVTTTGEQADGTAIQATYAAKYDGTENTVTGNAPFDTIAIKQVNATTFTSMQKKSDGKYNATGRMVISKDGKTLTNTVKGINADGNAFTYTMVYDKQ